MGQCKICLRTLFVSYNGTGGEGGGVRGGGQCKICLRTLFVSYNGTGGEGGGGQWSGTI